MNRPLIIAIDGPAASGKGTIARMLAQRLDLPHLDTGLTYRAVAHHLIENNDPLDDENLAERAARDVDLGSLDRSTLSQHHIGEGASKVAVMSAVRQALVDQQRAFANSGKGAVLDGRDIGTVVCPDAPVKLYITATPVVRAERRWLEIQERGNLQGADGSYERILEDIKLRDKRDMERADSPLKPADDAVMIDTSQMNINDAFKAAMKAIENASR